MNNNTISLSHKNHVGNKNKAFHALFLLIMLSLTIAPSIFLSSTDDRNYLLITMMIGGLLMFPIFNVKLYSDIYPILFVICGMFVFQYIFHSASFRITTLLFSLLFVSYYILGTNSLKKGSISVSEYIKFIKLILSLYFVTLLIQQICVLTGLPVLFGNNLTANPWKLNSLSAEPSHTARLAGLLMYSYIVTKSNGRTQSLIENIKCNPIVWFVFLYVMLTTISGTAFLVVALIFTFFLSKRNLLIFASIIIVIFVILSNLNITAFNRVSNFIGAVLSLNPELMIEADHSASVRIVPALICIDHIDLTSLNGWFGAGIDSTSNWMSTEFYGVHDGFSGGEMANYLLEFGIIVGLIFLWWTFKICYNPNNKFCSIGFWVLCVLLQSFNSQQLWCCLFLMTCNRYFHHVIINQRRNYNTNSKLHLKQESIIVS